MTTSMRLIAWVILGAVVISGCARRTVGFDVRDQRTGTPIEGVLLEIRQGYVLNPFPPGPIRVRTDAKGLAWARVERHRPITTTIIESDGYIPSSGFDQCSEEAYWVRDPKQAGHNESSDAGDKVKVYVLRLTSDGGKGSIQEERPPSTSQASSPR